MPKKPMSIDTVRHLAWQRLAAHKTAGDEPHSVSVYYVEPDGGAITVRHVYNIGGHERAFSATIPAAALAKHNANGIGNQIAMSLADARTWCASQRAAIRNNRKA